MTIPYIKELAVAIDGVEGEFQAADIESAEIAAINLTGGGQGAVLMDLGTGALKLEDSGEACVWSTNRQVSFTDGCTFSTGGTIYASKLYVGEDVSVDTCYSWYDTAEGGITTNGFHKTDIALYTDTSFMMTNSLRLPPANYSYHGFHVDVMNTTFTGSYTVYSDTPNIIAKGETMASSVVFNTEGEVLGACVRCWPVSVDGENKWVVTNLSNNTMTVVTGPS